MSNYPNRIDREELTVNLSSMRFTILVSIQIF